jgi:hypothetical protein
MGLLFQSPPTPVLIETKRRVSNKMMIEKATNLNKPTPAFLEPSSLSVFNFPPPLGFDIGF